jgi:hypothetical protein
MSIVDICASFAWFLSTWAVPADSGFAYASGNVTSCNFQGFLLQLAIGAPLYNSSLALFYLMVIKYNWTNEMLVCIEKVVHAFVLIFAVGTSIALLPLKQYNHVGAVCWVVGTPQGCGHSTNIPSDIPCKRGDYAYLYGLLLFYGPLWVCVLLCIFFMIIIFFEVKKTHERLSRYGHQRHRLSRSGSDTKLVASQSLLYTLSFFITWTPSTIWSVAHWFNISAPWLDICSATIEPLQGFINLLVFVRRRPRSQEKIRSVLRKILPCFTFGTTIMFGDSMTTIGSGHGRKRPSSSRMSDLFSTELPSDHHQDNSGHRAIRTGTIHLMHMLAHKNAPQDLSKKQQVYPEPGFDDEESLAAAEKGISVRSVGMKDSPPKEVAMNGDSGDGVAHNEALSSEDDKSIMEDGSTDNTLTPAASTDNVPSGEESDHYPESPAPLKSMHSVRFLDKS